MGLGSFIGVVVLTALAGALAACGLANFLIWWLPISNFEGGAGYFAVIVTGLGLIGGAIVGLAMAAVRSSFATAQMDAVGVVVALTLAAGILTVTLNDNGPRINGEKIVLEVELQFPQDWKPDNLSRSERGSGCWVQKRAANESPNTKPNVLWQQKYAALNTLEISSVLGTLALKANGGWVAACAVDLAKTTSPRYMRIYAGHKTDVTIRIPLPRHPDASFQQWSPWISDGFVGQPGKPAAAGYAFRFRAQGETDYKQAHPDEYWTARQKAAAEMAQDAPLVEWLPYFEKRGGQPVESYLLEAQARQALESRATELAPLLRSSDRDVVRRAVFGATLLGQMPASLIDVLGASGRHTIELVHEARANSLPGDPDLASEREAYEFFSAWGVAMDRAGAAGAAIRREVLKEIDREVRGDTGEGGIHEIAGQVGRDLEKLGRE